ncbi:MAG: type III-B CRISPR-associated protein Cas10/Cmr2, partial [Gammaproteobacteria bacterium]|nr:type III-B CRISPR-associated protein Cas10/Cmr2 [Gammaproteobacteria bacterium]
STHYLAAAPWIAKVIEVADRKSIEDFYDKALQLDPEHGEWDNEVRCVREARKRRSLLYDGKIKRFASLDAGVFFENILENPEDFPNQDAVPAVLDALRKLRKAADIGPPAPFYAVLLMDGDSLGKNMRDEERQAVISGALQRFTGAAEEIVVRHSGYLIYAGGDDVLAVLPVMTALPCALALREAYAKSFDNAKGAKKKLPPEKDFPATLSGAIEFAHIKMPLGKVLSDAHQLLDGVAKEGRGRDAIACRVWKPGGKAVEWAMPWAKAISEDGNSIVIQDLAKEIAQDDEKIGGIANGFFHRIRERLELLNPPENNRVVCHIASIDRAPSDKAQSDKEGWLGSSEASPQCFHGNVHDTPGKDADSILNEDQALTLMAAEYQASSRSEKGMPMEKAKARIGPLLAQCRPQFRHLPEGESEPVFCTANHVLADGALLVRFLIQKVA